MIGPGSDKKLACSLSKLKNNERPAISTKRKMQKQVADRACEWECNGKGWSISKKGGKGGC